MLVKNWMSKKIVTIQHDETITEAVNTLKRNGIRRLPVLKGERLVGIVTDRDLKAAMPSKATSLDIWEVHYLLSKIKVRDVMVKNPITINPDATIESAAIIMRDKKIGGLPVVEKKKLVGIITENDIFEALIHVTGAHIPSYRVSLIVPDRTRSLKEVCDILSEYDYKCISILSTYENVRRGKRKVILRFQMEKSNLKKVASALEEKYGEILLVDETKK
jgi:acetoin utilization protein AcuB